MVKSWGPSGPLREGVIAMCKTLQHYLNPLHIYCRLRKVFNKKVAREICWFYERTLWKIARGVIK